MTPTLSVVVPFFNVADHLSDCLDSLRRQTLTDVEVVLVDDGSTDASLGIAESHAADDPRLRIVRQSNQGLGPARNAGIAEAKGRYLAFVDSDDLVPHRAYQLMIGSLEESGSDFAAGGARRISALGATGSYLHRIVFDENRRGTSVHDHPTLALDRMAWNKVYRREFWDRAGLEFPAMLYEDYPVSIRAHLEADAVDMFADPVYFWREREGGDPSITQRRWEMQNLRDRVGSDEIVLDLLSERAPELLPLVQRHFAEIDVSAILGALHLNDPVDHPEIVELARHLLDRIPESVRGDLAPFHRVEQALLAGDDVAGLRRLASHLAAVGPGAEVRTRGWVRTRYFVALPGFDAPDGVPAEAYEVRAEDLTLEVTAEDTWWEGDELVLDLGLAVGDLSLGDRADVRVHLLSEAGDTVVLPVTRFAVVRPHLGADAAGARVRIRPDDLRVEDDLRPGLWRLHVQVKSPRFKGEADVKHVANTRARYPHGRAEGDLLVQPALRDGRFGVWVRRWRKAFVESGEVVGDAIRLVGSFAAAELSGEVSLTLTGSDDVREFPVRVGSASGRHHSFEVDLPITDLVAPPGLADPADQPERWTVQLEVNGRGRNVGLTDSFTGPRMTYGARTVVPTQNGLRLLTFLERNAAPVLTAAEWLGPDRLRLTWDDERAAEDSLGSEPALELRRRLRDGQVLLATPTTTRTPGRNVTEVDVRELVEDSRAAGLDDLDPEGPSHWHVLVLSDGAAVPLVAQRELVAGLAEPRTVAGYDTGVRVENGDAVRLRVLPTPATERSS